MNNTDLKYFKGKLEKEKKLLEEELKSIGSLNPNNPRDWEATTRDIEVDNADENEIADKFEELEENEMLVNQLEPQLKDVNEALSRIENGTYGKCVISGELIERDRLEANPSARTCKQHMKAQSK